jgi:hypothetical protein
MSERWRRFESSKSGRTALFVTGCLIVCLSPLVGVIPGPGGVFVFALGAGLMLKYSAWAKRRYVHLKRRWPRHAGWVDWGLRRPSARRRAEVAKRTSD